MHRIGTSDPASRIGTQEIGASDPASRIGTQETGTSDPTIKIGTQKSLRTYFYYLLSTGRISCTYFCLEIACHLVSHLLSLLSSDCCEVLGVVGIDDGT